VSLLGIDVGTTGCKAAAFAAAGPEAGECLASAYEEYDLRSPGPGQAELDSEAVWSSIKGAIARAVAASSADPVSALAVSSMGEAVVPVSRERRILGPSLLNFDLRGEEYLPALRSSLPDEELFRLNGNTLGNDYGLTKLMWLRDHRPELYERSWMFLNWGAFVSFMLGAEPALDYSLANRSLLFELQQRDWSERLLRWAGLERSKLPPTVPSGTRIGEVSAPAAAELGLPKGTPILAGCHDQCANAAGCGVLEEGSALFGMGTYLCIVPVYRRRPEAAAMIERGLNTEHHVLPDRYVSFIYNMSGAVVKWYRDTFAAAEAEQARAAGENLYDRLFAELPASPSPVMALPYFCPMGPPEYISGANGLLAGLSLETGRGEILKGILQGACFSLRQRVQGLPGTGIAIEEYRAAGGGSRSDAWVQLCADILERPFARPRVTEAGALGAAMVAGTGAGRFGSLAEASAALVRLQRRFSPDTGRVREYAGLYERYLRLWPLWRELLPAG
jgi:xylulokinase